MSCSYYQFRQNDYYCNKKGDYVNSDVYQRYCKGYNYSDCPIYKNEADGGCYITSACVAALGCSDDSEELQLLRKFRDSYMNTTDDLRNDVSEYYKVAPEIVERINSQRNFYQIYMEIYEKMIAPCIKALKRSEYTETYRIYKKGFLDLKKRFYL